MKLFISYGHDENRDFVFRVKRDLACHGHECWIDSERIHEQPDWRRSLMDALEDCDWTVGFLSRHAMRPGSITPQELAIAQDRKCGCLTTVLLEPLEGWTVPVSVGHAQWVDMSGWAARQAEGEAVFGPWYAAKLAELLDRLRPERAEQYAKEMAKLQDWLKPQDQKADTIKLVDDFVGRTWLVDILEGWRLGQTEARLFWLTGKPGTGKSAFSAWITDRHCGNVVALNLCRWDLRERCQAAQVVRTLACFIARRVQDYRSQLLRLMTVMDEATLDRLDASTLFDRLIVQPLAHCFDGGRAGDRLLLVVDGLDEAVPHQGASALDDLLGLLHRQAPLLPPWVGLVVTSRPEQPARSRFAGVPMLRIDANDDRNRSDLRLYARGWLGGTGRSPAEVEALVEAIDRRADGSFIYLRMLREAHKRGLPLDKDALPDGLNGLYDEWFTRQFPDAADYRRRVAPVLALILVAETPVPEAVLTEAMGWTDELEAADILESLGSLFERRGDGWAPFHKSLRDWLMDTDSMLARHRVPLKDAQTRLADLLWRHFVAAAKDPAARLSDFVIRELPVQAKRLPKEAVGLWVRGAGDWDAVADRCENTVEQLKRSRAWADVLAWCDLSDLLATVAGDAGWNLLRWVYVERGDVLLLLGRSSDALSAYQVSLGFSERLAAADPAKLEWQRELSVSHDRIGNVLRAQGELVAALAAYRDGLAIRERLAAADPAKLEWQRDLSISHEKIGNVLLAQGDREGALAAYRAGLAIRERLAEADPTNATWQRDLSVSHTKIGDVLRAQGELVEALAAYRAGMAIAERLAAADPTNLEWQRDLSVSHDRIGDVLRAQGEVAGALAADRADMAITERLATADPTNATWQRDLFVSLYKITTALLQDPVSGEACVMARRLDAQAKLLAARFPQDRERDDYPRWAADLLARACDTAA